MKLSSTQFDEYQQHFERYRKMFGLNQYRIYYIFETMCDDTFSNITVDEDSKVVTTRLNKRISNKDAGFLNIKQCAKHEAIHLLVNGLSHLAEARYVSQAEIYAANEALVNKLGELIGGDSENQD